MAHKKGGGSSRNGRDSNPQMLGVKIYGGQTVAAGAIPGRQRGTKIAAGAGVGVGRDDTLFALVAGHVKYQRVGKDRRRVTIQAESAQGASAGRAQGPSPSAGPAQGAPPSAGRAQGAPPSAGPAQGAPPSAGRAQGAPPSAGRAQGAPPSKNGPS